jgi:hypothetical protein
MTTQGKVDLLQTVAIAALTISSFANTAAIWQIKDRLGFLEMISHPAIRAEPQSEYYNFNPTSKWGMRIQHFDISYPLVLQTPNLDHQAKCASDHKACYCPDSWWPVVAWGGMQGGEPYVYAMARPICIQASATEPGE